MKNLSTALIASIVLVSSYAANAASQQPLTEQIDTCFRAHGHLMDKPGVKNAQACWRAHAYLMESQQPKQAAQKTKNQRA